MKRNLRFGVKILCRFRFRDQILTIRIEWIPNLRFLDSAWESENAIPGVYDLKFQFRGLESKKPKILIWIIFDVFIQKSLKFNSKSSILIKSASFSIVWFCTRIRSEFSFVPCLPFPIFVVCVGGGGGHGFPFFSFLKKLQNHWNST